jgi:hypothetical protein
VLADPEPPADDRALDLGGPGDHRGDPRFAPQTLHRIPHHVSILAHQLHADVGRSLHRLGAEELGDADRLERLRARRDQVGGCVGERPEGFVVAEDVGDRVGHRLEFPDRPSELLAFVDVGAQEVDDLPVHPDVAGTAVETLEREPGLEYVPAVVAAAEDLRVLDEDFVEEDLVGAEQVTATVLSGWSRRR